MRATFRSLIVLIIVVLGLGGLFVESAHGNMLIADWTFETSQPATAGPFNPEVGAGQALGHHAGATTYSSPVGNGSAHSFSSTNWGIGDYYEFDFATTAMTNLKLSFDQTSSVTGPGNFEVQTSVDGSTWTDLASYTVFVNDSGFGHAAWSSTTHSNEYSFNFSLPDGISGLRLVDTSTTSASGGTVGSLGTDRVDNVAIAGDPTPEPASLLMLVVGAASLGAGCRRRRPRADVKERFTPEIHDPLD